MRGEIQFERSIRRVFITLASVLVPSLLNAGEVLLSCDCFSGQPSAETWLTGALRSGGLAVREFGPEKLADRLRSTKGRGNVVLLENSPCFPADATQALDEFLKRGNHLIALSGPPLSQLMAPHEGVWKELKLSSVAPLVLESITPAYKHYLCSGTLLKRADDGSEFALACTAVASISRSPGFGCDSLRKWRQIPVAFVRGNEGRSQGLVAHLLLNSDAGYAGSVWGYVGLSASDFKRTSVWGASLVISMVKRIQRGLFLANAGTNEFAYVIGEPVRLGAYVSNLSDYPCDIEVSFAVLSAGRVLHRSTKKAHLPESLLRPELVAGESLNLKAGEYEVTVELTAGEERVDVIRYPFRVIEIVKPTPEDSVIVRGGDFYLRGRKWFPLGINYWPRYMAGTEPRDFSDAQWDPAHYNPSIVEEDLTLARALGLSMVSVQYSRVADAGPFMDFLARAHKHQLKVHVFLPGLHPLQPDFERASALMHAARLADNPAIFAYDLGWEVRVGQREARAPADAKWQRWVVDQYGSIENAIEDWGYEPTREAGSIVGASDEQLMHDGPWRTYVAAYRRFWDDTISRGYREMKTLIRSVDPHHLIGARSGYGGTGGVWIADHFPFDLASGAKHLDFVSPEHYEPSRTHAEFLRGAFTTAYARLVSGGKPVYWAEFGHPVAWKAEPSAYGLGPPLRALKEQADYFRDLIRMVHESGANGCSGWWWPAGYRVDEKSDFGIISPDLTRRPAADELAQAAKWFYQRRERLETRGELVLERDDYVTGYAGLYEAYSRGYAERFGCAEAPRLKTGGTDTDSGSKTLMAVGGKPINGRNPVRFLNAEFNYLRINGHLVRDGDEFVYDPEVPIIVDASVGNTGEAKWLSRLASVPGGVFLSASQSEGRSMGAIKRETPFLRDAIVEPFQLKLKSRGSVVVTFRMTSLKRSDFGETIRVILRPVSSDSGATVHQGYN